MTLLTRIRRFFGVQRRSSLHLTPKYERSRINAIRRAQAMFPNGGKIA